MQSASQFFLKIFYRVFIAVCDERWIIYLNLVRHIIDLSFSFLLVDFSELLLRFNGCFWNKKILKLFISFISKHFWTHFSPIMTSFEAYKYKDDSTVFKISHGSYRSYKTRGFCMLKELKRFMMFMTLTNFYYFIIIKLTSKFDDMFKC